MWKLIRYKYMSQPSENTAKVHANKSIYAKCKSEKPSLWREERVSVLGAGLLLRQKWQSTFLPGSWRDDLVVVSAVSKRAGVVTLRTPHKMLNRLAVVSTILVLENRADHWSKLASKVGCLGVLGLMERPCLKRIRWKRVEKDSDIRLYMLTHVYTLVQ